MPRVASDHLVASLVQAFREEMDRAKIDRSSLTRQNKKRKGRNGRYQQPDGQILEANDPFQDFEEQEEDDEDCSTTAEERLLTSLSGLHHRSSGANSLAGVIFMCNQRTKKECLRHRLFGLPISKKSLVEQVAPGMILFLFEFEKRELWGVFKAVSYGQMGIEPDVYSGGSFPCQVRVEALGDSIALKEEEFFKAISENYYSSDKFGFALSEEQVYCLCELFMRKYFKTGKKRARIPHYEPGFVRCEGADIQAFVPERKIANYALDENYFASPTDAVSTSVGDGMFSLSCMEDHENAKVRTRISSLAQAMGNNNHQSFSDGLYVQDVSPFSHLCLRQNKPSDNFLGDNGQIKSLDNYLMPHGISSFDTSRFDGETSRSNSGQPFVVCQNLLDGNANHFPLRNMDFQNALSAPCSRPGLELARELLSSRNDLGCQDNGMPLHCSDQQRGKVSVWSRISGRADSPMLGQCKPIVERSPNLRANFELKAPSKSSSAKLANNGVRADKSSSAKPEINGARADKSSGAKPANNGARAEAPYKGSEFKGGAMAVVVDHMLSGIDGAAKDEVNMNADEDLDYTKEEVVINFKRRRISKPNCDSPTAGDKMRRKLKRPDFGACVESLNMQNNKNEKISAGESGNGAAKTANDVGVTGICLPSIHQPLSTGGVNGESAVDNMCVKQSEVSQVGQVGLLTTQAHLGVTNCHSVRALGEPSAETGTCVPVKTQVIQTSRVRSTLANLSSFNQSEASKMVFLPGDCLGSSPSMLHRSKKSSKTVQGKKVWVPKTFLRSKLTQSVTQKIAVDTNLGRLIPLDVSVEQTSKSDLIAQTSSSDRPFAQENAEQHDLKCFKCTDMGPAMVDLVTPTSSDRLLVQENAERHDIGCLKNTDADFAMADENQVNLNECLPASFSADKAVPEKPKLAVSLEEDCQIAKKPHYSKVQGVKLSYVEGLVLSKEPSSVPEDCVHTSSTQLQPPDIEKSDILTQVPEGLAAGDNQFDHRLPSAAHLVNLLSQVQLKSLQDGLPVSSIKLQLGAEPCIILELDDSKIKKLSGSSPSEDVNCSEDPGAIVANSSYDKVAQDPSDSKFRLDIGTENETKLVTFQRQEGSSRKITVGLLHHYSLEEGHDITFPLCPGSKEIGC